MRFCNVCDNMMYINIRSADDDDFSMMPNGSASRQSGGAAELMYSCKSCGNRVQAAETDSKARILHTNYTDDHTSYKQYATMYIRHDPTLPRVTNIPCPSVACTKTPSEVIYIKYDFDKLRYLYHCCHCGIFWKSDGARIDATDKKNTTTTPPRHASATARA